jgi:subtilase family serine protease
MNLRRGNSQGNPQGTIRITTRAGMMAPRSRRRVRALALLPLLLGLVAAPAAGAERSSDSHPSCDRPAPGYAACMSSWQPLEQTSFSGSSSSLKPPKEGLTPADLRAAYALPKKGGKGLTIGIVDAYDHPKAEKDLAVYRAAFKLPACSTANKCFRKVDQRGGKKYPAADSGWATEIALDVQAVSAVCPQCKILLVEAKDASPAALGTAVNTAVRLGADVVSNSYGIDEDPSMTALGKKYYTHPGVPILASSGDDGFMTASFPAVLANVWAIGGTTLSHTTASGWTETAWRHGGSGCSVIVAKPAAQSDPDCALRTVVDVSVAADSYERFAVYDTFGLGDDNGWIGLTGTSLSSPLIAGMMGLAGHPAKVADPAYAYAHSSAFTDIVSGSNGYCDNSLCNAGQGYDAPTGLGTPHGLKGL